MAPIRIRATPPLVTSPGHRPRLPKIHHLPSLSMIQHRIAKLWERAMAAEQREDWSSAIRLYRKVVDAVHNLAACFQRLGLIALR